MLHKLKELAAEAEDDEEIVSDLIPQEDLYNIEESRDNIITNFTVIPVLICKAGYTTPTVVYSLNFLPKKR